MNDSDDGSTGGVEDERTGFWEMLASHARAIAEGPFGETVVYRSGGTGPGKEVAVTIGRASPDLDGSIRSQRVRLFVPVDAAAGLTIVEEGIDKVEVPLVYGGARTLCLVTRIVDRDPGTWTLEVSA